MLSWKGKEIEQSVKVSKNPTRSLWKRSVKLNKEAENRVWVKSLISM